MNSRETSTGGREKRIEINKQKKKIFIKTYGSGGSPDNTTPHPPEQPAKIHNGGLERINWRTVY